MNIFHLLCKVCPAMLIKQVILPKVKVLLAGQCLLCQNVLLKFTSSDTQQKYRPQHTNKYDKFLNSVNDFHTRSSVTQPSKSPVFYLLVRKGGRIPPKPSVLGHGCNVEFQ